MRNKGLHVLRCIAVVAVLIHDSGISSFFARTAPQTK